ncbi:MAG: hypothetical protein O7D30_05710 [Rickettsia endosymbiont of Ixodes persulcatus]|nr:hypothetical protein [Rickettsia endosymbiont of Ixodes persulcatus]
MSREKSVNVATKLRANLGLGLHRESIPLSNAGKLSEQTAKRTAAILNEHTKLKGFRIKKLFQVGTRYSFALLFVFFCFCFLIVPRLRSWVACSLAEIDKREVSTHSDGKPVQI